MVPRPEVVDLARSVAFDDRDSWFGQPGVAIDAVHPAALELLRIEGLAFRSRIVSCEGGILTVQARCPFILPMSAESGKLIIARIPI